MNDFSVFITDDGSHSLYVPLLDETYHSSFGAITESEHIFIRAGLDHFFRSHPGQNSLSIFEMGFGTGLNALLTYRYALKNHICLKYISIESNPLQPDFATSLNYPEQLAFENSRKIFHALHESPWEREVKIADLFSFKKVHQKIEDYKIQPGKVEVIYYDAFAPGVQPHIWDRAILSGMYEMLMTGGVLATYCAQGKFRRDLAAVGFHVEKLPGPPGKKEIVRAVKTKKFSRE